jgi:hypothetical protein
MSDLKDALFISSNCYYFKLDYRNDIWRKDVYYESYIRDRRMREDEDLYGLHTYTDLSDKRLERTGRVFKLFHNRNPK